MKDLDSTNFHKLIKVKDGTVPKFIRRRSVPFAFKPKLESELDRLGKLGMIYKIS